MDRFRCRLCLPSQLFCFSVTRSVQAGHGALHHMAVLPSPCAVLDLTVQPHADPTTRFRHLTALCQVPIHVLCSNALIKQRCLIEWLHLHESTVVPSTTEPSQWHKRLLHASVRNSAFCCNTKSHPFFTAPFRIVESDGLVANTASLECKRYTAHHTHRLLYMQGHLGGLSRSKARAIVSRRPARHEPFRDVARSIFEMYMQDERFDPQLHVRSQATRCPAASNRHGLLHHMGATRYRCAKSTGDMGVED